MIHFLMTVLICITTVHAQNLNSSEESSDNKKTPLTYQELRDQLVITGDIFVTDAKGKLLFQENQSRIWKFSDKGDIESNLIFKSPNVQGIYLAHTWSITPDAKIIVNIKQYDKMEKKTHSYEVTYGKVLKEEKKEIENFEPINWLASSNEKEKVFLRLVPSLSTKTESISITALPITLKRAVVFDNQGRVWAQGQDLLEGKYISMKTHLGQIALSYVPFKNAKEIGVIEGSQINIKFSPKLQVFIRSEEPILSSTKPAKVYGFIDFNNKTERRNSVGASSSNTEKDFNLR